jgi:hypothetical protein
VSVAGNGRAETVKRVKRLRIRVEEKMKIENSERGDNINTD